ncbi:MAG: hypothetical protein H5U37_04690 [Caldisericia bacterium]|nr:hypothetical protein [Caldisericia bacterium]
MKKKYLVILFIIGLILINWLLIFNSKNLNIYSFSNKGPLPDVWNVTYPISGTLSPGQQNNYGPYTSATYVTITVNWTPSDQGLIIGLLCANTGGYELRYFRNGYASTSWNLNYNYYYIIIILNPSYSNTKTINYNGTIIISYQ